MSGPIYAEIRALAALTGWDDAELDRLAELGDRIELGPGTYLTRHGVPSRQAFLLIAGTLTRSRPGESDEVLGPGSITCELEPLTGEPAHATVQAAERVTVLVLSPTAVLRFRRLRAAALGDRTP